MTPEEVQRAIRALTVLESLEIAMAEYYAACAAYCRDDAPFWSGIEAEERKHARIVASIASMIRKEPDRFSVKRALDTQAMDALEKTISQNVGYIHRHLLSEPQLYVIAHEFEGNVVEDHYYDAFESTDSRYAKWIEKIVSETAAHRAKIAKAARLKGY